MCFLSNPRCFVWQQPEKPQGFRYNVSDKGLSGRPTRGTHCTRQSQRDADQQGAWDYLATTSAARAKSSATGAHTTLTTSNANSREPATLGCGLGLVGVVRTGAAGWGGWWTCRCEHGSSPGESITFPRATINYQRRPLVWLLRVKPSN